MRNLNRILFLSGIILFTAFSCEEEKDDPADYVPIEIKKITDFGCDDCRITLKHEFIDDTSYVIYSENDFNKYVEYYTGTNPPSIDFEKYFLIIGDKYFTHGAELREEKAEENNIEIVYFVSILRLDTDSPTAVKYHAFFEKPEVEKTVRVEIVYKN
ncbi:MAG: hypothetical protein GQ564_20900 [Bacteroidales bacterium]|nr:hypothetical protein [Bacteroidales bacterium]